MDILPIKGSELKLLLKRKGITSLMVSDNLNINRTQLSRYFTDDVAMPANFILRVAAYANLSIDDLIKKQNDTASEPTVPYIKSIDKSKTTSGIQIIIGDTYIEDIINTLQSEIEKINQELTLLKNKENKLNHAS